MKPRGETSRIIPTPHVSGDTQTPLESESHGFSQVNNVLVVPDDNKGKVSKSKSKSPMPNSCKVKRNKVFQLAIFHEGLFPPTRASASQLY